MSPPIPPCLPASLSRSQVAAVVAKYGADINTDLREEARDLYDAYVSRGYVARGVMCACVMFAVCLG